MPIAAVTPLLTLDEANAWLGLEADGGDTDAIVTAAIAAASDAIANYIGYDPNSRAYTQTLDGKDTKALYLRSYPITAVSSLVISGATINPSLYAVTEERIVFKDGSLFPRGIQNITVAYTAGYTSMPELLKQAARYATKAVYAAKSVDPNVSSEAVPGVYSVSYAMGGMNGRSGSVAGTLPMNAQLLLDPFRRHFA